MSELKTLTNGFIGKISKVALDFIFIWTGFLLESGQGSVIAVRFLTLQSLCPLFFIKSLFFIKRQLFKHDGKCFLSHLKISFRSRDIQVFVFSLSRSAIALEFEPGKILKFMASLIV